MPSYTYTGDVERYYPDHGITATPGMTATFDSKPDDLWATPKSKKAAAVKAETDAAPAADPDNK